MFTAIVVENSKPQLGVVGVVSNMGGAGSATKSHRSSSAVDRRGRKNETENITMIGLRRREPVGQPCCCSAQQPVKAATIAGRLPSAPNAGNPPPPMGGAVREIQRRRRQSHGEHSLIASSRRMPETPGGKDAGCAILIDRPLAGPAAGRRGCLCRPPFQAGLKNAGHGVCERSGTGLSDGLAAFDGAAATAPWWKALRRALRRRQAWRFSKAVNKGNSAARPRHQPLGFLAPTSITRTPQDVGSFLQTDLWREPRHGRVEDDRLSRARATTIVDWVNRHNERSAAAGWHDRASEMDKVVGLCAVPNIVVVRFRLDRRDHG